MSAEQLEQIVIGTLQGENESLRVQAEAAFNVAKRQPEEFLTCLTQLLCHSQRVEVRQFCAVMMRQYLSPGCPYWGVLSATTQVGIKNALLQLFRNESNNIIRRSTNDVVGMLAGSIVKTNSWPELIPCMMNVFSMSQIEHKCSALHVLSRIAEFAMDVLRSGLRDVKVMLRTGLTHQNITVKAAALKTTIMIMCTLNENERLQLLDLLNLMFQVLDEAVRLREEEIIRENIEELLAIAKEHPTMMRDCLRQVMQLMLQIADFREFDDSTRRTALEFLLTLTQAGKGMVRKVKEFARSIIPLAFRFACDLEHSDEWDDDEEEESDIQNHIMGLEAIDRLAETLGEGIFMGQFRAILDEGMRAPDDEKLWPVRYAAYMSLSTVMETCNKTIRTLLPQILPVVFETFRTSTSHPRLQWAAMHVLGQMGTDLSPDFQAQYHTHVFPMFVFGMSTSNPRVICHAAGACVDFLADCTPEILAPALQPLLEACLHLIQHSVNIKVKSAGLSLVAAVAGVAGEGFIPFYPLFMNGLVMIIRNAISDQERIMRGRAMEVTICAHTYTTSCRLRALGMIVEAVGKHTFAPHCAEVMQLLLSEQFRTLRADDPQLPSLWQSLGRVCHALRQDFVPFLEHIIPGLLTSAANENAFIIQDASAESTGLEEKAGYKVIDVSIRHMTDQRVTVNTALLEEKALACKMLAQYAKTLEQGYFAWVLPTARVLAGLVRFAYNEAVRVAAISAMPALLESAASHCKLNRQDPTIVRELWALMVDPFKEALVGEMHLDQLIIILDTLADSIATLIDAPDSKQSDTILAALTEVVNISEIRRKERGLRAQSPDFDEEEAESIANENEEEDSMLQSVHLVVSALVKKVGGRMVETFHRTLFPLVFPMLAAHRDSGTIIAALCIMDDVVEYAAPESRGYVQALLTVSMTHAKSKVTRVRQAAVWGIGACGRALGPAFMQLPDAKRALDQLVSVVNKQGSREESNETATDDAISAIGKICRYVLPGRQEEGKYLLQWLRWLPCTADEEEARLVHADLVYFIQSNNTYITSQLPLAMAVLAQVAHTEVVTPDIRSAIALIWADVQRLPAATVAAVTRTLKREQLQALNQLTQQHSQRS